MEQTPESAIFAEFLAGEFSTPEEREAFEHDVAQVVASANLTIRSTLRNARARSQSCLAQP